MKELETTVILYSEGKRINECFRLDEAMIRVEANHIGKATLRLYAGDTEAEPFEISDDNTFRHGSRIKVEAVKGGKTTTLFEGIVISTELQVGFDSPDKLVVECRHYAWLMTLGRRNAVFEESKDCDVFRKIISGYSDITLKSEDTSILHPSLVQYYCTDWDFMLSRADICGMIVCTDGQELRIGKPDVGSKPVGEFTHRINVMDFEGSLSSSGQYTEVNAVAWDYTRQEIVLEQAEKQSVNEQGDLRVDDLSKLNKNKLLYQTDASPEKDSLKNWANAMALRTALSRYQGTFTVEGDATIMPGVIVSLKGFGKRFDGNVWVGSVEHIIRSRTWRTRIGMGLSDYKVVEQTDVAAPLASGLLPGIQGLHIGVVRKLHEDPAKEERIQIELPLLNSDKKNVWARLATLYSGEKAGMLFVPEIGEEVVVGFFNNDPCCPVVLGCLFGSKMAPPVALTEANGIKTIITKEQLKLEFNDEKKIITLSTPGGAIVEMDDDQKKVTISDQNKNNIVMDSNGITIQSDKDIKLTAKGNLLMEANSKASVKAKSDLSLEGSNINGKAQVGVTLKGNATAELSASGQTTIKGGMVMIN